MKKIIINKKLIYSLIVFSVITTSFYFCITIKTNVLLTTEYCAFCDFQVLDRQKFYEDASVIALCTYKPILPGHCLVIPKRHVERFDMLTGDEMANIGKVLQKVHMAAKQVFKTSAYLIMQKNGVEVGQTVPHVHFHYIPRILGDSSILKFLVKMYISNFGRPLLPSKLQEVVERMKLAMIEIERAGIIE